MRFLRRRLCERSSINFLITGIAAAGAFYVGNPTVVMTVILGLTAVGFFTPDGRVRPPPK